jgi:hypothetical protein
VINTYSCRNHVILVEFLVVPKLILAVILVWLRGVWGGVDVSLLDVL